MSVLPDHWIEEMARTHAMIEPYADNRLRPGRISYGVSSYGYDFRLSDAYKIPEFSSLKYLDPKKMDRVRFRDVTSNSCRIPGNSFVLARSLEYFRIPRDVLVLCQGKSTYARCGLLVNVTPFEPEWQGYVTISLVNTSPLPLKVYSGEGVAQIIFIRAESECAGSYGDRKGKYQAQKQIQPARV
jgi:dCTP deaminase